MSTVFLPFGRVLNVTTRSFSFSGMVLMIAAISAESAPERVLFHGFTQGASDPTASASVLDHDHLHVLVVLDLAEVVIREGPMDFTIGTEWDNYVI
jgi:hypothetical protein